MSGALAIFAKTKSLSPVKTRLAADIGQPPAEKFYALSVKAVAEIAKTAMKYVKEDFKPYWALAEKEALHYKEWQDFQTIWTGDGGLGMRLHTVYSRLRQKHRYVVLIGTDSPQLEPKIITQSIMMLHQQPNSCVIGPAFDGGFYLLATKASIAQEIWTKVNYSQTTTLNALSLQLGSHGIGIERLPFIGDVDRGGDLRTLLNALLENNNLLPAQKALKIWLHSLSGTSN